MLIFVSCFIIPFVVVIHQQCYYINMSMLRFVSSSISKREYTIFCFDLIEHSPILIYLCIKSIYLYLFITSISIFLCIYASIYLHLQGSRSGQLPADHEYGQTSPIQQIWYRLAASLCLLSISSHFCVSIYNF